MRAQYTGGGIRAGHAGHPGPLYQPPAPDDPAVVGGHRIAARLGVGALGPVYLAYAPDGRPVALTVVRPELAERSGFAAAFEHDVQAVLRVRGPYTVPVLGSGHDGSRYWLAAGYVPALTLHAAVSDTGRPLPVPVVLRLVSGVAEALRAVHHAGVVHAGLGPGTVLLAADGPRVTGYGVTRAAADAPGIPAFSSPEQAADKPPVPATDIFALGQIAAYAAIGTAPFGPRGLHEEPDLSELPGELREIVTRCLIKDPALRPSPSQVIAMCTQAAHHRPPSPWLPVFLQTLLTLPPPLPPVPPPDSWPQPPHHASAPGPVAPPVPAPVYATPPGGVRLPAAGGVPGRGPVLPSAPPVQGATPAAGVPVPSGVPATWPTASPAPLGGVPAAGGVPSAPPVPGGTPPGGIPMPRGASGPAPGASGPSPGMSPTPPGGVPVPPGAPGSAPGGGTAYRTPPGGVPLPPAGPPGFAPGGETCRTPPQGVAVPVGAGRRRSGVMVTAWAAAAVVLVGAVALAGGFDRGRSTGARPQQGSQQTAPATVAPRQTAPGGREYRGVGLDAGNGLALETDPPQTRPGAGNGTFGYAPDGESFVSDATRGALVLIGPDTPGTLDGCRGNTDRLVGSVPRARLTTGSRLCVVGADGTTALVTFRRLSDPGGPAAHAVLDLTVWPPRQL